jgi:hypothetical protein
MKSMPSINGQIEQFIPGSFFDDALDAILCLMQAAWAQQQHEAGHPQYGLPPCDPLEG